MREGWYLMSTRELERALGAWRDSDQDAEFGIRLTSEVALKLRDAGNVPDAEGRSLRLVLFVDAEPLERKRLQFEPDYHEAQTWRREGSALVNVVALRTPDSPRGDGRPWWEMPRVKEMEAEWQRSGAVAGIKVDGQYRSFVFKTVIALQDAGLPITPDTIADSVGRWLGADDAARVRASLQRKEPGS